jgi:hypothetical protein
MICICYITNTVHCRRVTFRKLLLRARTGPQMAALLLEFINKGLAEMVALQEVCLSVCQFICLCHVCMSVYGGIVA